MADNDDGLALRELLVAGGDTRLTVDSATGLNAYGCSPCPRPGVPSFSSCTASTISEHAYRAADRLRRTLAASASLGQLCRRFSAEVQSVRADLRHFAGAEQVEGSEVILAASGTDCELLATWIARLDPALPAVNIVVGKSETGSGVMQAAAGCHFAARTAQGVVVQPGRAVDGLAGLGLTVETVPLRDCDGRVIAPAVVDRTVERLVESASTRGAQILLHVLDVSKTGLFAPRLETVLRMAFRHGRRLTVIVDACQFRTAPQTIARYLTAGWLVQVTGSKFFTGPPFAGALLVPPALAESARRRAAPEGLTDYATRDDFPGGWHAFARRLGRNLNYGLLLRWRAALTEMQRFSSVAPRERYCTLARFGTAIQAAMTASPHFDLLDAPQLDRAPLAPEAGWDSLRTIFSCRLRDPADGQALDMRSLRRIHALANLDIRALLPSSCSAAERRLAARPCQIGQPVALYRDARGRTVGALRIAAGARLVSAVAFDCASGRTVAERRNREIARACLALHKIDFILRHWAWLRWTSEDEREVCNSV